MIRISLALAGALFACAGAAQSEIRFGVMNEAYPPFFTKDASGTWVGWEIELMDAVCAELKEECSIVDMSWDGLIPGLASKKFDVIWSSMSITPERRETIDFTDRYYNTPSKLIGYADGVLGAGPQDVAGKTIGIQVSTIQSTYYAKYFKDVASEKTYSTLDEAFQDLAAGRIDYVFGDSIPLMEFLKTDFGKGCCEDKGNVVHDAEILGEGIGGGLRKEDAALRDRLNTAIAALRANGTYAEISGKYFTFDPYGK
ncbi:transporter substrate-binding domain-containing protein [Gemmobacter fulvus]|uniref:Transporter substrate-binding domain-containing protein n=1 Tax=Gemmobacter fulvus TaxID=2840474 RepID=A0A975P6P9_9RHOB|nr:transporter substrate-binding domain-containing protein [Gemmobacter fulvus]MBT9245779.1 transporter substrate-binding domain-containing protein [Gemmobacter fulvus]MDQ1847006.1 transporter substrate-binding domain-containing protein [Gemmobacter fulvus]QWK89381.1 transporter substrate-binding domain-containing protein [Gemmobacter fulvus]